MYLLSYYFISQERHMSLDNRIKSVESEHLDGQVKSTDTSNSSMDGDDNQDKLPPTVTSVDTETATHVVELQRIDNDPSEPSSDTVTYSKSISTVERKRQERKEKRLKKQASPIDVEDVAVFSRDIPDVLVQGQGQNMHVHGNQENVPGVHMSHGRMATEPPPAPTDALHGDGTEDHKPQRGSRRRRRPDNTGDVRQPIDEQRYQSTEPHPERAGRGYHDSSQDHHRGHHPPQHDQSHRSAQERGGHRQTNEGHIQTNEGHRQTHEGHRQPHEGYRQTHEDHRQTHEGHRQPHEGHRQPHEGHRQPHGEIIALTTGQQQPQAATNNNEQEANGEQKGKKGKKGKTPKNAKPQKEKKPNKKQMQAQGQQGQPGEDYQPNIKEKRTKKGRKAGNNREQVSYIH